MDNYLRIMEKLFYMREYIETSLNEQQHRKMYLALLHVEEQGGIAQCENCRAYFDTSNETSGLCSICNLGK